MAKWNEPIGDPPFWLDKNREITAEMEPAKPAKGAFILLCISALLNLGCSIDQALAIAANAMVETGWGRYYKAWNLGGWKITKGTASDAQRTPRWWWRAPGNKDSGDPPWCFYRAFSSAEQFFMEWLYNFVPKPGPSVKSRYKKTGEEFWNGKPWFDDLIAAGYKGEVTKKNPAKSIASHEQIVHTLVVFWCQHLLGVTADGQFGPKSQAALKVYQKAHFLKETGALDDETLKTLLHPEYGKVTLAQVLPLFAKLRTPDVSKLFDDDPDLEECAA